MQVSLSVLINSDSDRQPQIPADPSVSHRYQGLKLNKSYLYSKKIKIPNVYSASTYAVRSSFKQNFFNYDLRATWRSRTIEYQINIKHATIIRHGKMFVLCKDLESEQQTILAWLLIELTIYQKTFFYALHFYSHFTGVSFLRLFQIKLKKSLRTISNRGSTSAFSSANCVRLPSHSLLSHL